MFRKSSKTPQYDLFTSTEKMLSGKSLNLYEDKLGWHNLFYKQVTQRIDESIFKPLYTTGTGSPNAPVQIMVAMMVLKEAQGYSDAKLFEDCRFNILTRSALGLVNVNDKVPVESTYYLFRKQVNDYAKEHESNLFDEVFRQISKSQCIDLEISGKRIRMDSKLLGSNIAWLSRYELVHQSLGQCYKKNKGQLEGLEEVIKSGLEKIISEKAEKAVYRLSSDEIKVQFKQLGLLIDQFLAYLKQKSNDDNDSYKILKEVFDQQFEVVSDQEVITRDPKDISAKSIQSPYDSDAHYRSKGDQQIKGYSANVTESCDDDDKPNLIADVSVKEASTSDTDFLQPGIEQAKEVFTAEIEAVHADGAYHSPDNQEFCNKNNIDMHLHAIQGHKGRYSLEVDEKGENIVGIVDRQTSQKVSFKLTIGKKGEKKWRIKAGKGYRYFAMKDVKTAVIRKKVADTPREILQKRNNVEATIFQLSYHCSGSKTKYRGLIRHQMWADMRCLWVNFVRIKNYLIHLDGERAFNKLDNTSTNTFASIFNAFLSYSRRFWGQFMMSSTQNYHIIMC